MNKYVLNSRRFIKGASTRLGFIYYSRKLILFSTLIGLLAFGDCHAKGSNNHSIIILNSYHPGHEWTSEVLDGEVGFLRRAHRDSQFLIEFLDLKRYPQESRNLELVKSLSIKLDAFNSDIVITNDNLAFEFAVRHRANLFPGKPIVFGGINGFNSIKNNLPDNVTGVAETIEPLKTLEKALLLHPSVKKIYVILDSTPSGQGTKRDLQEAFTALQDNITIEYLDHLNLPDILNVVGSLAQDNLILLPYYNRDRDGTFYSHTHAASLVSQSSNVPVYHLYSFALGTGIIGGYLLDGKKHGQQVGELVLKILEGKAVSSITPIPHSKCLPYFDHQQLIRWNVNVGDLPPDSIIINEPFSFYDTYKTIIIIVISAFFLQAAVIVVLLFNITAKNKAERKLRSSEHKYRQLVENANDAIVILQDEKIVFSNTAMADLIKCKPQYFKSLSFFEFVHPEDQETIVNNYHLRLNGDTSIPSTQTFRIVNYLKETRIAQLSSVIVDWGDRPATLTFIRDITDLTKMEENLNHMQKMEAIGTLTSGVAHDFNNMLGGILGATELLGLSLPNNNKALKLQQIILDSARRAAELTQQLLVFSRQSNKASSIVNIHKIIQITVELLKRTADKRVLVNTSLEAELSNVVGDQTLLQNSFLNLLINAAHSMPKGGTIWVNSENMIADEQFCKTSIFDLKPGNYIEVEIRDEGYGIAPEHIGRIFEPFFTTKEEGKGTGLGLASVYGAIQQHNGSITVYSEVGNGTSFRVMLLISEKEMPIIKKETEVQKGHGHILVVDDEEVVRTTAGEILEELGYKVTLAENGQEAVELYTSPNNTFDLVLLDMVMPIMNGRDCFELIKKYDHNACVILSSGFTKQEDLDDMIFKGLEDFIRKPYHRAGLSEKIYKAIKKH